MLFNNKPTTNYQNGVSTTLEPNTGAIGEFSTITTLTTAQLLAFDGLDPTSVQIIPAPGADLITVLESVTLVLPFNAAAYQSAGAVNIIFVAGAVANVVSNVTQASFAAFITAVASSYIKLDIPNKTTLAAVAAFGNQPIKVNLAASTLTTGDSPVYVLSKFSVVPSSLPVRMS